jgi:hypothetical protein
MGPWVVSAVKFGASELMRRDMFDPRVSVSVSVMDGAAR